MRAPAHVERPPDELRKLAAALDAVTAIVRKGDAARLLDRLLRRACEGLNDLEAHRLLRLAEYVVRSYAEHEQVRRDARAWVDEVCARVVG